MDSKANKVSAAVVAQLQQPGLFAFDRTQPVRPPAQGMHAGAEHQVGLVAIGKSQTQFVHRRGI